MLFRSGDGPPLIDPASLRLNPEFLAQEDVVGLRTEALAALADAAAEIEFRQCFDPDSIRVVFVVDMGESLKFKPTFMVKAVLGAPVEADLSANFLLAEKFWLGAMYRTGDSYGFLAQWVFNRSLRVGYAVDFSTTRLRAYHNGTHEVMVSYELRLVKEKYVSPRYF